MAEFRWNPTGGNVGSPGQSLSTAAQAFRGVGTAADNILKQINRDEEAKRAAANDAIRQQVQGIQLQKFANEEADRRGRDAVGKAFLSIDPQELKTPASDNSALIAERLAEQAEIQKQANANQGVLDAAALGYNAEVQAAQDAQRANALQSIANTPASPTSPASGTTVVNPGSSATRSGGSFFSGDSMLGRLFNRDATAPGEVPATTNIPGFDPVAGSTEGRIKAFQDANPINLDAIREKYYPQSLVDETARLQPQDVDIPEPEKKEAIYGDKSAATTKNEKLALLRQLEQDGEVSGGLALTIASEINKPNFDAQKLALKVREQERKEKETAARIKEGYLVKSKKNKTKGFDFTKELLSKVEESGHEDDMTAAIAYLRRTENDRKDMSKDDKRLLLNKLVNKFGRENQWFTTTGWDDLK